MEPVIFPASLIDLQDHLLHLGQVLNQSLLYTLVIGLVAAQSTQRLSQLVNLRYSGLDFTIDAVQLLSHPSQSLFVLAQLTFHACQFCQLVLRGLCLEGSSFGL